VPTRLTGTVTDTTGAAVNGASVKLINTDTNYTLVAKTDGVGVYLLRPIPIGPYRLTIEADGFSRYQQEGIELTANMAGTQNVTLKVSAGTAEVVTVTADAELVNTTSAELGVTVGEAAIEELPLNGRDPSSLVLLAPGTSNVLQHGGEGIQTGFSFATETGASSSGGRQGSTFYMLDGVSNMDNYNLLTAPFPNSDATQEFKAITNNFRVPWGDAGFCQPRTTIARNRTSAPNVLHRRPLVAAMLHQALSKRCEFISNPLMAFGYKHGRRESWHGCRSCFGVKRRLPRDGIVGGALNRVQMEVQALQTTFGE